MLCENGAPFGVTEVPTLLDFVGATEGVNGLGAIKGGPRCC